MCNHYSITKNQAAIRDLFKVAHDTTGAAAVRRAKVLKLVEPKEAPWRSQTRTCLTNFLAKVGAGKQVLEFHKNQHVFEQGDVADTVFYVQKGTVKLTVRARQGSSRRDFRARLASSSAKAA